MVRPPFRVILICGVGTGYGYTVSLSYRPRLGVLCATVCRGRTTARRISRALTVCKVIRLELIPGYGACH